MLLYRRAISFTTLAHTHSEKYYKRHDMLYSLYLLLLFFFLKHISEREYRLVRRWFYIFELKIYDTNDRVVNRYASFVLIRVRYIIIYDYYA